MTAAVATRTETVEEAHAVFHLGMAKARRELVSDDVQTAVFRLSRALARHAGLSAAAALTDALTEAAVNATTAADALIDALAADGGIEDETTDADGVTR